MTIASTLLSLLASFAVLSRYAAADYSSMSRCERSAFIDVAKKCSGDVQRLCRSSPSVFERSLMAPPNGLLGSPTVEIAPQEIQSMLDQFLGPSFLRSPASGMFGTFVMEPDVVVVVDSSEFQGESDVVDSLLHHVLTQFEPPHFHSVAEAMNERGLEMMRHPNDESIVQTGRRLQEVATSSVFLPFAEGDCLDSMFQYELATDSHQLSPSCSESMRSLKKIRADLKHGNTRSYYEILFFACACVSILLGLLVLDLRRYGAEEDDDDDDDELYYVMLDDSSSEKMHSNHKVHVYYEGVRVV